jgi:predicted RNA-binding Zn-ribbon protein involved in translation (DUF1610 family)
VYPDFAQRLVLLSAVALLAAIAAVAIVSQRATSGNGSRGQTGDAQRTTCGQVLTPESLGVTHPVLPCGAKVILRSGDKQVLSEVIDNALVEPGRQLEVTDALAKMLGIHGTVELQWRFATTGGSG